MTDTREKKAHVWERGELDWYVEPVRATEQLLQVEKFIGGIWDPCCGGGNVLEACNGAGYAVTGTDIVRRDSRYWFVAEGDFLAYEKAVQPNIVMNPPYFRGKGSEAFIRKAVALVPGKVCAFVDVRFMTGAGRANGLYKDHPPHRVWMVTPRVSCPPGTFLASGGKAGNGSSDYVWLVWDNAAPFTGTALGWLR
ncbi:MAG: hypothetical protein AB7F96_22200 [Beijerinckiaceae bacterium]